MLSSLGEEKALRIKTGFIVTKCLVSLFCGAFRGPKTLLEVMPLSQYGVAYVFHNVFVKAIVKAIL